MLRAFVEKHIDEEFTDVPSPKTKAEFYDCTFHKLNGATLKDCTMHGSKFVMTKPEDIIGLTLTMDCFFFTELELSPEVFDMLLLLICKTKGNTQKRLKIIEDIVGHDRAVTILNEMKHLER